jgi:D-glycero-D-manno-heptose 1,7-bisphosphate phosphatase
MTTKVVFLDRDGVLNVPVVRSKVPHPPQSVQELALLPGVEKALERLKAAEYLLICVTNQPDVARGKQYQSIVEAINIELKTQLPWLDQIIVCYHDDNDNCSCRKPRPGMLLQAAGDRDIDFAKSYMVGDRWSDIEAGYRVGCKTIFLDHGYAEYWKGRAADFTTFTLTDAADWILQ